MRTVLHFLWQASLFVLALLIGPVMSPRSVADTVILYVNANVQGGAGDGTSWSDAYPFLQDALADAAANAGEEQLYQIWVVGGAEPNPVIYYPDRDADNEEGSCNSEKGCDPTATFELHDHVELYGGFTGSESDLGQRAPLQNITVLSGLLDDDPEVRAYHVVTANGIAATARLDGFFIEDGDGLQQDRLAAAC